MLLNPEQFKLALKRLDDLLAAEKSPTLELRICGGGALSLLGISTRETRDIDVIKPPLSERVLQLAEQVSKEQKIPVKWINNGPASLDRDLDKGWEGRCKEIYSGKVIHVLILGRRDLIASKLYAFCDRDEADLEDLLVIKPTGQELDGLLDWTLYRDGSEYWPARVKERFTLLKRKLGFET